MDDNTDKKLSDNANRVAAVGALHQIRKLVENFDEQDRKNKRKAIALIIATLIFAVSIVYFAFVLPNAPEKIILNSDSNQSAPAP